MNYWIRASLKITIGIALAIVPVQAMALNQTIKILKQTYRIQSISVTRSYSYESVPVNDLVSSGSESFSTSTISSIERLGTSFVVGLAGTASGSYEITGGVPASCSEPDIDLSLFGATLSFLVEKVGSRFRVSAAFGTSPSNGTYEGAINNLCPDSAVGIRAYLIKSLDVGEPDDSCDGNEMCLMASRSDLSKNRIRLHLSKLETVSNYDGTYERSADITIVLKKKAGT